MRGSLTVLQRFDNERNERPGSGMTGIRGRSIEGRSIEGRGIEGRKVFAAEPWPEKDLERDRERGAVKAWTRQEAQAWAAGNPQVSPWRVVGAQAIAGIVCGALVWAGTQRSSAAWSALYGAAAVVIPSALLARGMTKRARHPVAAAAGFMFWEMLKIGVSIAMLVIASKVVTALSWPALLVAMVVCIKVNWFALLWRGRRADKSESTDKEA